MREKKQNNNNLSMGEAQIKIPEPSQCSLPFFFSFSSVFPFAAILDGRQVLPEGYWKELIRVITCFSFLWFHRPPCNIPDHNYKQCPST